MRCTRCNGVTIPQALGRTPDGQLVFGWCLPCLQEENCREIVVAQPERSLRKRMRDLTRPSRYRKPLKSVVVPVRPQRARSAIDDRYRLLSAVLLIMSLWGVVLVIGGLVIRAGRPAAGQGSPFGNPTLLTVGGVAVTSFALSLWFLLSGRRFLETRPGLKAVQVISFLVALVILGVGISFHDPRRDPLVVFLTSLALSASVTARWIELRRYRAVAVRRN